MLRDMGMPVQDLTDRFGQKSPSLAVDDQDDLDVLGDLDSEKGAEAPCRLPTVETMEVEGRLRRHRLTPQALVEARRPLPGSLDAVRSNLGLGGFTRRCRKGTRQLLSGHSPRSPTSLAHLSHSRWREASVDGRPTPIDKEHAAGNVARRITQ